MAGNAYLAARGDAAEAQQRNRDWWNALPMTYEAWDGDDRSTTAQRVVGKFLEANPYLKERHFDHAGQRVLEIGCGAGPATILHAKTAREVVAVDLSDTAIEIAKRHTAGLPNVEVRHADAEHLPFDDASFDHVFSWGVMHHSAHPEQCFAETARVLRPGGTALIMVYNKDSLRYWIKGAIQLFLKGGVFRGEWFDSAQKHHTDGYFHKHFWPGALKRELKAVGLTVTSMRATHMAGQMIPLVPHALDEWLKDRSGWLLVAEATRR